MKPIISSGGIGSGSGLVTMKKMNIVRMTLLFVGMTVACFIFYNSVFPSRFLSISLYDYTGTTYSQASQLLFCHQSNSNIQTPLDHVLIPILFYFSFGGVIIPIPTPACSALLYFYFYLYFYLLCCVMKIHNIIIIHRWAWQIDNQILVAHWWILFPVKAAVISFQTKPAFVNSNIFIGSIHGFHAIPPFSFNQCLLHLDSLLFCFLFLVYMIISLFVSSVFFCVCVDASSFNSTSTNEFHSKRHNAFPHVCPAVHCGGLYSPWAWGLPSLGPSYLMQFLPLPTLQGGWLVKWLNPILFHCGFDLDSMMQIAIAGQRPSIGCGSEKCIHEGQNHSGNYIKRCLGWTQFHIWSVSGELSHRKQHQMAAQPSGSDLLGPESICSLLSLTPSLLRALHSRCQLHQRGIFYVFRLLANDVETDPIYVQNSRERLQLCLYGENLFFVLISFEEW